MSIVLVIVPATWVSDCSAGILFLTGIPHHISTDKSSSHWLQIKGGDGHKMTDAIQQLQHLFFIILHYYCFHICYSVQSSGNLCPKPICFIMKPLTGYSSPLPLVLPLPLPLPQVLLCTHLLDHANMPRWLRNTRQWWKANVEGKWHGADAFSPHILEKRRNRHSMW